MTSSERDREITALLDASRKANEIYELQANQMQRWGAELRKLADALTEKPAQIYGRLEGLTVSDAEEWRPTDDLPFLNVELLIQKSALLRRYAAEREDLNAKKERLGIR